MLPRTLHGIVADGSAPNPIDPGSECGYYG